MDRNGVERGGRDWIGEERRGMEWKGEVLWL